MVRKQLKLALRNGADMNDCRELLRHGSRSFYAASLLLPREYRDPITALYAYCRVADDAVDLAKDPHKGLRRLSWRLKQIYRNRPSRSPVDRAFSRVVHKFNLPNRLPAALLEGFEWDVNGRRYETLSDTRAYGARVAGTVGAMMALLMDARDPEVISRACDLGVAMQLTNIARDVGEDARAGRVYLPVELLDANGVNVDDWLREPCFNAGIATTVKTVLESAEELYSRAEWGISQLPVRVRPAMFAARSIYAEIGREIENNGYDSVSQRAIVSGRRKAQLLMAAMRSTVEGRERDHAPTLEETSFLVDAIA